MCDGGVRSPTASISGTAFVLAGRRAGHGCVFAAKHNRQTAGTKADGSAWRESWQEVLTYDSAVGGEPFVERTAHKWAKDAGTDPMPACTVVAHS